MNSLTSMHFLVKGKVQGVGFRWFSSREAKRLGLTGWVKNLPDGRVEGVAEGDSQTVIKFLESIAKGPMFSHVEGVEKTEKIVEVTSFNSFDII